MGSCQNKSATIKKNTYIKKIKDPCTFNAKIISKNIDQKFDDMPEWPGKLKIIKIINFISRML